MIREALIGAALIGGGGYYVMTYSVNAAVVRTVKATPYDTWRPFDLILNQSMQQFATMRTDMRFPDGTPITQPIVSSVQGKEIDFRINKGAAQAMRVHLTFEPLADGAQTKMTVEIDISANVIPQGRMNAHGGPQELKRELEKLVDQLIPQIESGKLVKTAEAFADLQRRVAASPQSGQASMYAEEYKRREAQTAAGRPMVDPNEAALDPKGANAAPSR
jgi:hypothetical protein